MSKITRPEAERMLQRIGKQMPFNLEPRPGDPDVYKLYQSQVQWINEARAAMPFILQQLIAAMKVSEVTVSANGAFIVVQGQPYRLEKLVREASVGGGPAWRLTKPDGTSYDCYDNARYGLFCECPDFIARRENTPEVCKHIAALQKERLL